MKKYLVLLSGFAAGIASFWYLHVRPSESNRIADTRWHEGGDDKLVTIHAVDVNGNPIRGEMVVITGGSGTSSSVTDNDGRAIVKPSGREIQKIEIGGETVVNRPYWIGTPNIGNGLIYEVKMKEPW